MRDEVGLDECGECAEVIVWGQIYNHHFLGKEEKVLIGGWGNCGCWMGLLALGLIDVDGCEMEDIRLACSVIRILVQRC